MFNNQVIVFVLFLLYYLVVVLQQNNLEVNFMTIYFGENVKKLRKEHEMTQEELANVLGVSFQAVSKWERGETFPDITMLPVIANYFNVSTDDLLGVDKVKREEKINEYLDLCERMRFKDKPLLFSKFQEAIKEFPSDYRLLIRYLELYMDTVFIEKDDNDGYEKASQKILSIYDNIQNNCTDDSIRMWSKRLVCTHLWAKTHHTKLDIYQKQAEEILNEMPELVNSREYLATLLMKDKEHFDACTMAIEELIYLLINSVNHYCFYDFDTPPQFILEAMYKIIAVCDTFYTDGNYGKNWLHVIYTYGNIGRMYAYMGDNENAIKNLKICVEYTKKYDELPAETKRNAQFFEDKTFKKTPRGHTKCQRIKHCFLNSYNLPDEFKELQEFKDIIEYLG